MTYEKPAAGFAGLLQEMIAKEAQQHATEK
jgi:hypothetical protein